MEEEFIFVSIGIGNDVFCCSTFNGDEEIALAHGYKKVSVEDYEKLCNHEMYWHNGELIPIL